MAPANKQTRGVDGSDGRTISGLAPPYKPIPADIEMRNHKAGDPSRILFKNVNILDSTGREPFSGDILVEGERIVKVGDIGSELLESQDTLIIDGEGNKTLLSGLCDADTHLSWTNAPTIHDITNLPLEEHVVFAANSAKTYLDCGYTMCFGAAAAKPRLDICIKRSVNQGLIPGPRILSNAQEIATSGGALVDAMSKFADGPDEMRKAVREFLALGVDNIKLSLTGDYVHPFKGSEETYFTLEEVEAAVEEAHNCGKRVCAHARSCASIKLCCKAGVDVIYHASFVDEEGLEMLEALKDQCFVAPAINYPLTSCTGEATPFGLTPEMAAKKGLKREVEIACTAMNEMRKRGIRVLPGGDFGFAWAPHGTYARDLAHFVNLFGFSPMETIIAATAWGGELMGHPDELGKVLPGYYADLILVDGNPLEDIEMLQDTERIHAIIINGHVHKNIKGKHRANRPRQKTTLPVLTPEGTVDWQVEAGLGKVYQNGK